MGTEETKILKDVQTLAKKKGWVLFRNNVGLCKAVSGNFVRYGLCTGSSDLIGWKPRVITSEDVGMIIAQFVAVEVKTMKGKTTDEQIEFLRRVVTDGGIGKVIRNGREIDDVV